MGIYNEVDIAVTASGDLSLGASRDFALVQGSGVLKQDISFRIRTNPGEFEPHLDIGAGLDEIIGEPNTRETKKIGESKIVHSLVYDGRIANTDLYVRGVPMSIESVMYYVFVNNGRYQMNVSPDTVFTMMNGFTNRPGV